MSAINTFLWGTCFASGDTADLNTGDVASAASNAPNMTMVAPPALPSNFPSWFTSVGPYVVRHSPSAGADALTLTPAGTLIQNASKRYALPFIFWLDTDPSTGTGLGFMGLDRSLQGAMPALTRTTGKFGLYQMGSGSLLAAGTGTYSASDTFGGLTNPPFWGVHIWDNSIPSPTNEFAIWRWHNNNHCWVSVESIIVDMKALGITLGNPNTIRTGQTGLGNATGTVKFGIPTVWECVNAQGTGPVGIAGGALYPTGLASTPTVAAGLARTPLANDDSTGSGNTEYGALNEAPPNDVANTSGTANAAVTTTNTTLRDTRTTFPATAIGQIFTCNGKTMTCTAASGTDTATCASWSGGGNPGNGFAWTGTASFIQRTAAGAVTNGDQTYTLTQNVVPSGANVLGVREGMRKQSSVLTATTQNSWMLGLNLSGGTILYGNAQPGNNSTTIATPTQNSTTSVSTWDYDCYMVSQVKPGTSTGFADTDINNLQITHLLTKALGLVTMRISQINGCVFWGTDETASIAPSAQVI